MDNQTISIPIKKPSLLLRAPATSKTGYGAHATDVFKALYECDLYDLYLENCFWGIASVDANEHDEYLNKIYSEISSKGMPENPDIYITMTIANEFDKKGKINIGFTAGVEIDRVAIEWLDKINQMDFILVPSKHSMNIIRGSSYTMFNDQDKSKPAGVMQCQRPIGVVFEGVDTKIFNAEPYTGLYDPETKEEIKFSTDKNLLFVGMWLNGNMNEDRKNVAKLIYNFFKAFIHRNDVGLVLKTSTGTSSIFDRYELQRKIDSIKMTYFRDDIDSLPKIHLIHGYLTNEEMAQLYKHPQITSFISLTHGEGYGRPIAEAAACNLPVITTGWSGQVDFLDIRYCNLLTYELVNIPQSVVWPGVLPEGSRWAEPNENSIQKAMMYVINNEEKSKQEGIKLGQHIRSKFSYDIMKKELPNMISQLIKVCDDIKLQQMQQMQQPQIPKLNLPKLKKIEIKKPEPPEGIIISEK